MWYVTVPRWWIRKITVFCDVTPCSLLERYYVSEEPAVSICRTEKQSEENSPILRHHVPSETSVTFPSDYTVSHLWRLLFSDIIKFGIFLYSVRVTVRTIFSYCIAAGLLSGMYAFTRLHICIHTIIRRLTRIIFRLPCGSTTLYISRNCAVM
jgi:hypothetical protein